MSLSESTVAGTFGLLPEPERRPASFLASTACNAVLLALVFYVGMTAKRVIEQHRYEQTVLVFPITPPPLPKLKIPPPPRTSAQTIATMKLQPPKIAMPKIEPRPDVSPIHMETKVEVPLVKAVHPAIVLAAQPKPALAAAPAQLRQAKSSAAPVHLGEIFGVTPNASATRPATIAAIGSPYGGMNGPASAPRGIVGSTGIGNSTHPGYSSGGGGGKFGRVASAGIPGMIPGSASVAHTATTPDSTSLEIIAKPAVQYTSEARQLKIQGNVILRVTFTAAGQVVVHGLLQGLGHGLDEEARRVAQQIRFRPATRNGQVMDITTNITITFQIA